MKDQFFASPTFCGRRVHATELCDYDLKSTTNTHVCHTQFQSIIDNTYDFLRLF